jgi:hypothetical protein
LYARKIIVNTDGNYYENIIIDISKTNFINLKVLCLSKLVIKKGRNHVSSIEQLQFMSILFLDELILCTTLVNQLPTASQMSQSSTNVGLIA